MCTKLEKRPPPDLSGDSLPGAGKASWNAEKNREERKKHRKREVELVTRRT